MRKRIQTVTACRGGAVVSGERIALPANQNPLRRSGKVAPIVKKLLVLGASVCGTAATAFALLGAGVASADDAVVGQTFADAKRALSQQGMSANVATTVGDRKDWNQCIVSSATPAASIDGFGGGRGNVMNVNLNCYAKYGTALWPGYSLQNPTGRKMWEADIAAKEKREAQQAAAAQQAELDQLAEAGAQTAGE